MSPPQTNLLFRLLSQTLNLESHMHNLQIAPLAYLGPFCVYFYISGSYMVALIMILCITIFYHPDI